MSHTPIARRDRVDSRLLVVGSQIANLTPGPSFAHNLGWRCPSESCEAILNIYTSRPFQWYQKHSNARCFDPCNQALSFWEFRRIPSPQLWETNTNSLINTPSRFTMLQYAKFEIMGSCNSFSNHNWAWPHLTPENFTMGQQRILTRHSHDMNNLVVQKNATSKTSFLKCRS
jgi:hypothetical protein